MKMLKIAFLVKRFCKSGGKELYAVEVARELVKQGHQVDIFSYVADSKMINGITFHQVPKRLAFSSVLNTLSFIRETTKMLQNNSYDIIHSHERNYKQDVLTLHSFSYLSGLEKYSGLRRIEQKYFSLRSLCYLWLEKKQMTTPWLISVSDEITKDVRRQYNRTENIVVMPPGVDTELFHPDVIAKERTEARIKVKAVDDELVIVFVGSAFKRKGLDRLFPVLSKGMRLLVVGSGDNVRRYKRKVKEYRLENQVQFVGLTDDVRKYLAAADVMVLPSRSEAFGISILEGMACGLPVIVSVNSGVAALIKHEENGFLMKHSAELSGLLKRLYSRNIRTKMGEHARKTAENFSWEKTTEAHEKFYRYILSQKTLTQNSKNIV